MVYVNSFINFIKINWRNRYGKTNQKLFRIFRSKYIIKLIQTAFCGLFCIKKFKYFNNSIMRRKDPKFVDNSDEREVLYGKQDKKGEV